MKRWCPIVFGVLALLTVTSLTARAVAKPLSLEKRFERAQKLHDQGRCQQALPLFEELTAATKSPNARLYIARCLKQVGRIAEAYEQMRATTREARTLAATESRYVATRNAAAAELAIIEPMVGRLLVRLAERPSGLTLKLNNRQIALTTLARPLGVAPGRYTLVARAPGRSPLTLEGRIAADELATIDVNWNAAKSEAPSPPMGKLRIGGIVVSSFGVASLAAFGVTAVMAKNEFRALEEKCGTTPCPPELSDRVDKGRTLQTVANVSLAVGSAAILAGSAMIIFGGPSDAEPKASQLVFQAYPFGASLRGRF